MDTADTSTTPLHLVASNANPSAKRALREVQHTLGDISMWIGQVQNNERNLLCLWPGQSEDNRKWDRIVGKPVAPFDGCADTRVRLIDESVAELCQLQVMSFFKANPIAVQQEATDARASAKVGTLLKYELRQRMFSELWQEMNFLCAWKEMTGHAVMQMSWKNDWVNGKATITPEELAAWLAEQQAAENEAMGMGTAEEIAPVLMETMMSTIDEALVAKDRELMVALIRRRYPTLSEKRAKDVVSQLIKGESAEFRLPVKKPGKPSVKARCPGIDVFYPYWTDNINTAPWVAVVDTLSEVDLRKKPMTEGWDQDFVDQLITLGPQPAMDIGSMPPINASAEDPHPLFDNATKRARRRVEELRNAFQVIRLYVRSVDEDGIEQVHEIVCHPSLGMTDNASPDKDVLVGVNHVVDHWYDACDFVSVRREFTSRPLWESRGVPEVSGGYQWELKKWRDQSIDRNDLAVFPPLFTTHKNAAGKGPRLGVAPGAILRGDRGDEARYMEPPQVDGFGAMTEDLIRRNNANLLGLQHNDLSPAKTASHQQWLVTGFLIQAREIVIRILALDQQFMDPMQVERVIGNGPLPFKVTREEIAGQFDVSLQFDVMMNDPEVVKTRWAVIKEAMANDPDGVMSRGVFTRWLVESIDPSLADMGFKDPEMSRTENLAELRGNLTQAATMQFYNQPREGVNSQAMLADLEQQLQSNPMLRAAYTQDPQFAEYVNALRTKYGFDVQQYKNASIGRNGWDFTPPQEKQAEEPVLNDA